MPGPPPLRRRSPPGMWSGRGGGDAVKPACPHARVREGAVAPIARYDAIAIRDPAPGCFFALPLAPPNCSDPLSIPVSSLFFDQAGWARWHRHPPHVGQSAAAGAGGCADWLRPRVQAAKKGGCGTGDPLPHSIWGGGGGKSGTVGGLRARSVSRGGAVGDKAASPPCAHLCTPRHRDGVPRGTTGGGLKRAGPGGGGALQPTPRPPPAAADDAASAPVHGRPACLAV